MYLLYKFKMLILTSNFFIVLIIVQHSVLAIDDVKDRIASDRGALWFGPRLGKRSLKLHGEDNRQTFLRLLEAADALKFYYDQLPFNEAQADDPEARVTKKVIFTPKLGRNLNSIYPDKSFENVEFTPRLGRRLSESFAVTPPDQQIYKADPDQIDPRTKYFSPRLGRNVNFSPRLGRELPYDLYTENIRLARSINNDTKSA
ncbi:hypothetical protein ACJJTC_002242 [Scirpophaga incertulas]